MTTAAEWLIAKSSAASGSTAAEHLMSVIESGGSGSGPPVLYESITLALDYEKSTILDEKITITLNSSVEELKLHDVTTLTLEDSVLSMTYKEEPYDCP